MWPTTRGQCETNLPDVHGHLLIGDGDEIIAGHGRVEAAKLIGLQSVPAVRLSHLDAAQRRAYVLADNKLALNAGWDRIAGSRRFGL